MDYMNLRDDLDLRVGDLEMRLLEWKLEDNDVPTMLDKAVTWANELELNADELLFIVVAQTSDLVDIRRSVPRNVLERVLAHD